ncbi:MAG: nuclear transport factor 2 family protein [Hyphomicrobiales bacterium]|nr:nuclear transport factor 2 family protein [Hyphomicrobiales bacterium]MCC2104043.1 nuclear transport factor 2 family protein [Hyphomicrobiales bacterium]MCC2108905.1 nuclear transport factor 2 family protein [Hyphomicrobiales bacterium]
MLTSNANRELVALDRELIEQRIRAMWDLRRRGAVESVAALLSHDCVYAGKTWFGRPVDIRREGRDACLEWARQLNAMVQNVDTQVLYLIIDGERAAACRKIKLRERGSGRIEEVVICSYMRFRSGEIVEIVEHPDTLAVKRLLAN